MRGTNSDLADEGEVEFYFVFDSVSDSEIVHFLPDTDNLPEEDLVNNGEVPKAYEVPRSLSASALEDEAIQGFKQANYQDIRDACAYLDKILFDIDNDREMLEPDIRNRLTEAYKTINNTKQRVSEFNPDSTNIIYTDQTKDLFLDYLDSLEDKIRIAGWETGVNVEREYENRENQSFNTYNSLEIPRKNPGLNQQNSSSPADIKHIAD